MSKDNRKKGCPNINCQMNVKKVKQTAENDFCPKCGTKLIFVCSKCFDEIEDLGKKHRICKKCEIEAAEKAAKGKAKAKDIVGKGLKAVGTVAMVGVTAFTSEGGKQVRKKAAEVGKKAAQVAFKMK